MIIDEAIVAVLSPVLGEGLVYSGVSPEILERDIMRGSFKPFAIFRVAGGVDYKTFARVYDDGKDHHIVQLEIWGARIADVRRLALRARRALVASDYFLGIYREGGMDDMTEFGNKLYGIRQEFSLWFANEGV